MYISDKLHIMKKNLKKYSRKSASGSRVQEVYVPYDTEPRSYRKRGEADDLKEFTYSSFKSIADRSPFTIGEWAQLLYISERTLHRYAKEDRAFDGLHVERILLLDDFIASGNDLMGKEGFKKWVHSTPFSLGEKKVFDSLFTHQGIVEGIDLLHRIQNGIPA